MALFKDCKNTDPRCGLLIELPDHYWIGQMLFDKYTLTKILKNKADTDQLKIEKEVIQNNLNNSFVDVAHEKFIGSKCS